MNEIIPKVSNEFASFLNQPINIKSIDLSNSTLLECIQEKIHFAQLQNPNAHKQYHSLIKSIVELETATDTKIMPGKVNDYFWALYMQFLYSRNKSANSIRTITAQLKAALEWASKHGAKIDTTYSLYNAPIVNKQQVALTPDDVSRIYHFDIDTLPCRPQHKRALKRVRDMFCLMCNVGLRYSDAKRITAEHIKDGVLDILQQKTKRYAHIELSQMAVHKDMLFRLLEKYDNCAPCNRDNTYFDRQLHELMIYCGYGKEYINQETILNGEVITERIDKASLITSHTARRTFIVTNALRGKPALEIMRASGHKTFMAFQKYLCYY